MVKDIKKYNQSADFGQEIIYEVTMESTNSLGKKLAKKGVSHGTLVVTRKQTAGRGRMGRQWLSPEGNCYFSLILRPQVLPECVSRITLVAAMAMAMSIKDLTGLSAQIKWPNDVVINKKKVCGILTESSFCKDQVEYVVLGVGVNVNQTEFDASIAELATSLSLELSQSVTCERVVAGFINRFEEFFVQFENTNDLTLLLDQYNELLVNLNQKVRVLEQEEWVGIALGINKNGELLVQNKDGIVIPVVSGEVSVRGIYGYV